MSSIAAAGAGPAQAMQQAVTAMKAVVDSQKAATDMLSSAVDEGAASAAASGSRGTNLDITV